MHRRLLPALVTLLVLAIPVGNALTAPAAPARELAPFPDEPDALDGARWAVDEWARHNAASPGAHADAEIARAGLAFTEAASREGATREEVLEALPALVEAHGRAIGEAVGADTGLLDLRVEQVGNFQRVVALAEELDAARSVSETLSVAAAIQRVATEQLSLARALHDSRGVPMAPALDAPLLASGAPDDATVMRDAVTLEGTVLTALRIQPRPEPREPLPPMPRFDSLQSAIRGLLAWYEHPAAPEDEEALQRLDDVPPALAEPLTRIVEAHVLQADATRRAFAGVDAATVADQGRSAPAGAIDDGLLLAARDVGTATLLDAAGALRAHGVRNVPEIGTWAECGVFMLNLTRGDSAYEAECDYALSIDLGGDDTYRNNAGGSRFGRAATLLDFDGDDEYSGVKTRGGLNGGSQFGSGILIDVKGNDTYDGSVGVDETGDGGTGGNRDAVQQLRDDIGNVARTGGGINGGSNFGSGLLIDTGGHDLYRGATDAGGINGGSAFGSGVLIDTDGNDAYDGTTRSGGINGGSYFGTGLLIDSGGDDAYDGAASNGGINGAGSEGEGLLVDTQGNDAYAGTGSGASINGGGGGGSGLLIDTHGNDTYTGTTNVGGINGGGHLGSGLLIDTHGNDTYNGTTNNGGINGGGHLGSGLLIDARGDDRYDGRVTDGGGVNGGAAYGVALLLDAGGSNAFTGRGTGRSALHGAAGGMAPSESGRNGPVPRTYPGGLGLLLTGPGDDTYELAGAPDDRYARHTTTQGAATGGGIGILHDGGGSNTYRARSGSLAQGAGSGLSLGLLLDHGRATAFTLEEGAVGQGAGLQGIGILARAHAGPAAATTYDARPGSSPGATSGAGIGLRLDFTIVVTATDSIEPTAACARNEDTLAHETGTTANAGEYDTWLCAPDDDGAQPVRHPVTAHPLAPVPKPALGCSASAACTALVTPTFGPDAVTWLDASDMTMTTSGSLLHITERDATRDTFHYETRIEVVSVDELCRMSCFTMHRIAVLAEVP